MNKNVGYCMRSDDRTQQNTMVIVKEVSAEYRTNVRDPETPRDSGWPAVSGQPLGCLNVVESSYGITGA